ncbi:uncharacterized protein C8R40DRAFT_1242042 [Lentinula edodes]|uniref:uncharacterized protein n=1 Tax=Lentinula edodes TaxID=5353 RepID=UPI001E8CE3E5|nr:uncharacterized protein C8R40DRAFT_1242042 [Lentinula edodes]KAH7867717.1 hypothetical protein C8R40DRAFT_1242042 [Lentinula edodes]
MFYVILPVHTPLPAHYMGTQRYLGSRKTGWSNTNININDDTAVKRTTFWGVERTMYDSGYLGCRILKVSLPPPNHTPPLSPPSLPPPPPPHTPRPRRSSSASPSSLNDKFPPSSSDIWDSDDDNGWQVGNR